MRAKRFLVLSAALGAAGLFAMTVPATPAAIPSPQAGGGAATAPAAPADPNLAKIREEGLKRSQVMDTLNYLSNVIGPRLTGSPNLKRANEWTRDQMAKMGLSDAHLESWNFGGRGWVVKRFAMQVVEPQQISLIAYPKAWSPGLAKAAMGADVVLVDARTEADLQKYKGKLKGAIVLDGGIKTIGPDFTPLAVRLTDQELQRLANVRPGTDTDTQPLKMPGGRAASGPASGPAATGTATGPATGPGGAARGPGGRGFAGGGLQRGRVIQFLMEEGALMELTPSSSNVQGILVGQASEVLPTAPGATAPGRGGPSGYSLNAPESLPQVTVSVEGYNRLVRMAQLNVPLKIDVDLQVQYTSDDPNCYNTIAEIPGSDLKDEVVMLGAHLDSWHMGTGATDNGTGVAECMEAMRIIKALGLKPRRTIRVGLWTGEEEGLLGARAYVREHFGVNRNLTNTRGGRGGGRGAAQTEPATETAVPPATTAVAASQPSGYLPAREEFSCYFNTDEGGGRFRGIYASTNSAAAAVLQKYLEPVKDLGITIVSPGHATGSDHQAFEGVGLPAFHFMPDPIDYWAGTWHTSQDLYDHVVPEDIKAASVIMASFIYQAAMADEKMPRTRQ